MLSRKTSGEAHHTDQGDDEEAPSVAEHLSPGPWQGALRPGVGQVVVALIDEHLRVEEHPSMAHRLHDDEHAIDHRPRTRRRRPTART